MFILFDVGIPAISKHLKNIFEEGELQKDVVVSKMEITTPHGAIEGNFYTFLDTHLEELEALAIKA